MPAHADICDESANYGDGEDNSPKRAEASSLQWSKGPDIVPSLSLEAHRDTILKKILGNPEESIRKRVHLLQLSRQKGKYEFNY